MDGFEVLRTRGGHGDFANIVNQARDIIDLVIGRAERADDFARENRRADAVLPEIAPGKERLASQLLEILDDRRDHHELANLPHAEIEDRFLDIVDRRGQAVIDGVDQPQEPGGEAGVAPDYLRHLRGVALVRVEQFAQGAVDAAQ